MALYVGDGISLVVEVIDPVKQVALDDLSEITVELDFFGPGKDPKNVPADRTNPDATTTAAWDPAAITKTGLGAWLAYQTSAGFVAGKWNYRVRVTGAYQNVEYGSFSLKA